MILRFEFENLDTGWRLEPVRFEAVNLLVGPSGAGKSKILEALQVVRQAALRGLGGLPSARWRLDIGASGEPFVWEAETRVTFAHDRAPDTERDDTDAHFVREDVRQGDRALVHRNEGFEFLGDKLPKLDVKTSAIELLASEEKIEPLARWLERLRAPRTEFLMPGVNLANLVSLEADRRRLGGDLAALRREQGRSVLFKLYVLQQDHQTLFDEIVEDFRDVFPNVEELRLATLRELRFRPRLEDSLMNGHVALGMRERGVEGWVVDRDFSSGMEKTLALLVESRLAPGGTTFLLDEMENSLGVNCLPDVASLILRHLDRIQFIATSHHPQVINGIPTDHWKIVTRRGSTVRVIDAESITALQTASPLEKFTQLLNLPEYEEGIA